MLPNLQDILHLYKQRYKAENKFVARMELAYMIKVWLLSSLDAIIVDAQD